MKQQFLSVLFCVLIGSTLGHEYLRAHELTLKARHHQRSHTGISQFRDNDEQCTWQCPVPNDSGTGSEIRLIILKEISVVAVLNVTANVAISVDLQANIAVLFNGESGEAVFIDLKAETGIAWGKEANDKLWIASQTSLAAYLLALGTLTKVKDFPNGQTFEIKSVSKEIILSISVVISQLGSSIASRLKVNLQVGLSIVLALSKILVVTLGGSLSILIKTVEATEIILKGGLVELTTLLQGLASFAAKITGGLEALLIADINFKLSLLLGASSSLEALIVLLNNCAHKVDLSKVLGPIIKSVEDFLGAIVVFGQGEYNGVSGIITVLYNGLLVISKKISIADFVDIIIQLAADGGDGVSKDKFIQIIDHLIEIIQIQITTFNSSQQWQAILTFFSSLKAGNLKVGGIDISAIVTLIIENAGKTSLNLVIGILVALSAVVGFGVAVATLFLRLVFFVISGQGIVYILQLLPSIKLNLDLSSDKSIISQILSGVSVSKILRYLITFDIIGLITSLPVLGDIFKAVSDALEAAGKSSSELTSGLKLSGIASSLFQWVRFAFGLDGGSGPSGGIAGQTIIGGGISISISSSTSVSIGSESTESTISVSTNRSPGIWGWGPIIRDGNGSIEKDSGHGATIIDGKGSSKGSSSVGGSGGGEWSIQYKRHNGNKKHQEDRQKPRQKVI